MAQSDRKRCDGAVVVDEAVQQGALFRGLLDRLSDYDESARQDASGDRGAVRACRGGP